MARIILPAGTDLNHLYEIHQLADQLMSDYGLIGWRVVWDRAHKRAGQCNWDDKVINLSAPLMALWTIEQAEETILHEIAHAKTPRHGHDAVWRDMCRQLGIKPERCWGRNNEQRVPERFKGVCPDGHISYRTKKPTKNYSCAACSTTWDWRYIIQWHDTKEV